MIRAIASQYTIITEDKGIYQSTIRGTTKRDYEIMVGDFVEFSVLNENKGVIEKVLPRKNRLIRPYVSNIDNLIIVVAPVPQPDWVLVDKLIISCYIEGVEPILCLNKVDLADNVLVENFFAPYKDELKCIKTSVINENVGLKELYTVMNGKLSCFAGQSAVGKSSIINAILGRQVMDIGEMSKKVQRGKHTTRHIEIFDYGYGRVVDTCGFSLLELGELLPEDLTYYYEYVKFMDKCKFANCTHINEPDCKVKEEVAKKNLSQERYDRYKIIFNELKEKQDDKY